MSNRYRVSIPVEAAIQDGIDVSITHKLKDGITLGDMLRVRVEDTITYLEIEVEAEERHEAITSALVMAWRLVQLISLVYNKGFEVGLAGIRAILIAPLEPPVEIREEEGRVHVTFRETLHISDYLRITEYISTLDPLLPIWKRMNQSASVTADGLEWLYLGKIASNERMAFLAHWLAFELLVERSLGNEPSTTVLKKYIPKKEDRALIREEMRQLLRKYIQDDTALERLVNYFEQTKLESDIDRWTRTLQKSGVNIQLEEVQEFIRTRGAIVHQSGASRRIAHSPRLREVVAAYLDLLLLGELDDEMST